MQVPHAFVTEHELRQDARAAAAAADRAAQHAADEAERQRGAAAAAAAQQQQQGAAAGAGAGAAGERPLKRPKPEKVALSIPQALGQLALDKHPLMVRGGRAGSCRR